MPMLFEGDEDRIHELRDGNHLPRSGFDRSASVLVRTRDVNPPRGAENIYYRRPTAESMDLVATPTTSESGHA